MLPEGNYRVAEIECRSLLNQSRLADYAVNCYAGCEHGCVYCYARFATRFSHPREPWGSFIDVKVNAPRVLAQEVKWDLDIKDLKIGLPKEYFAQGIDPEVEKLVRQAIKKLADISDEINLLPESIIHNISMLKKNVFHEHSESLDLEEDVLRYLLIRR